MAAKTAGSVIVMRSISAMRPPQPRCLLYHIYDGALNDLTALITGASAFRTVVASPLPAPPHRSKSRA
jgi:hypothetical protein